MEDCENFIKQRRMYMSLSTPPIRYNNLESSPYPEYTSEQLNMRRKVEILKYNKNGMSKKERQAAIARGNYRGSTLFCGLDSTPKPSSAAGVPGPSVLLFEDPNVPLYNYANNTTTNAIVASEDTNEWNFYILPNKECPSGLNNITNIASLLILPAIQNNIYTYTYITPMVFHIQGTNIPVATSDNIITISLNNIATKIFYSGSEISNNVSATNFDENTLQIKLKPDTAITSNTFAYSAKLYVGYITISNIYLNTSAGFTYNFGLTYNAASTTDSLDNNTTILTNTNFSIVANVDDTYNISDATNCEIISPNSSNKNKSVAFLRI